MTEIVANSGLLSKTRAYADDTGGSGRPVVLIHGWPLSAESWEPQIPALAEAGHRVVAYDRRGFGRSDKPDDGYDYDTLADDLEGVLAELDLRDVTLVGISMGGGEVARYVTRHGQDRLHSVVLAAAVPPYLLRTDDNPEGALIEEQLVEFQWAVRNDPAAFYDRFVSDLFSAEGEFQVSELERRQALALCLESSQEAAVGCLAAWITTDFRHDLPRITVPTLVLHGDADVVAPFESSAARTHALVASSRLVTLAGAPHGCNVSHAEEFNRALLDFLDVLDS